MEEAKDAGGSSPRIERKDLSKQTRVNPKEAKGRIDKVDFWVRKIREEGAALTHGKFHPDWFSEGVNPNKVTSLEHEPGFADMGHANTSAKRLIEAYIPSVPTSDIFQYGNTYVRDRFNETRDQVVLMSPARPSSEKYNQKMLDGRFQKDWRVIEWGVYVKQDKHVPFRTPTNPMNLKIFLLDAEAVKLFKDIESSPDLPEKIFHRLYPKIPYQILGKKRLYAKSLSEAEAEMPYARSVQEGGQFFEIK